MARQLRLRLIGIVAALLLVLPAAAGARCDGIDLLQRLPADERAAIAAAADAVPYPAGNLWRATRGEAVLHIVGTFHIGDARLAPVLRRLEPLIEAAEVVLVEVTPDEEQRLLAALAAEPSIAFVTEGPSLIDLLSDEEWALYTDEMAARGVPAFMASRFRPWLAFSTLTIPACLFEPGGALPPGLDDRVITHAVGSGVRVNGLEGYDVLFRVFDALSFEESLDLLRATLMQAELSEDLFATLANAYFAEEHRLIWEFGRRWMPDDVRALFPPERVEPLYDRLEEVLLARRNRDWLGTILDEAAHGPVLVAVGAAHLSGHDGLLDLLERAGFTLERLPLAPG